MYIYLFSYFFYEGKLVLEVLYKYLSVTIQCKFIFLKPVGIWLKVWLGEITNDRTFGQFQASHNLQIRPNFKDIGLAMMMIYMTIYQINVLHMCWHGISLDGIVRF